jgi:hypothetical protein
MKSTASARSFGFSAARERVLRAIASTAEEWDATWQPGAEADPGTLYLPIVAGLRRGFLEARVTTAPDGSGVDVRVEPLREELHLQWNAVVVLGLAALGALTAVLWPFVPALQPLLPFALLIALSGWFLVVTRLRSSGVEEFFAAVGKALAARGDTKAGFDSAQPAGFDSARPAGEDESEP